MSCFLRWNALSAALAVLPRVRHAEPSERLFNALALDEPLANVLLGALLGARVPGADFDAHIARSRVFGAALVEGLREGRLVRGDGSYARRAPGILASRRSVERTEEAASGAMAG